MEFASVKRVYLAGPPYADEYRRRATKLVHELGWEAVDPMRRDFRGRTEGRERELVEGDLADIDRCDAVLAAFTHADEGTAMEAWYARAAGKPVVGYTGGARPHPWTVYVAASVHEDLEQAIAALQTLHGDAPNTVRPGRRREWPVDTEGLSRLEHFSLLDWKRRVFDLYREVCAAPDPAAAWQRWRAVRDELFSAHPQSPIPPEVRGDFGGLDYYAYDPRLRVLAEVVAVDPEPIPIGASGDKTIVFERFGQARFELMGEEQTLELYWLQAYGGGLFLPFADETAPETYSAGRYLLDTVKGADLGVVGGRLVLDFNFAYNPSCAYDPRWVCPLAPPANRLAVAIRAGERQPLAT